MIFHETCDCRNFFPVLLLGDLMVGGQKLLDECAKTSSPVPWSYEKAFAESDLVFANFEGVMSSLAPEKRSSRPPVLSFPFNPSLAAQLQRARFPLLFSLANNHTADCGHKGLEEMLEILAAHDIRWVGAGRTRSEAREPHIITEGPLRIAFFAFTDLLPFEYYAREDRVGAAFLDRDAYRRIRSARGNADFVIVSLHTVGNRVGAFSRTPDHHQRDAARAVIDAGADLVVGSHPHGLQIAERYKNGRILYSLGTYFYDPRFNEVFQKGDPLHSCTQLHGGAMARLSFCTHGLRKILLEPTRSIRENGIIRVRRGVWHERALCKILARAIS